ncbi:MAG: FecR domain-containing protein [Leeuwenhoekiella sp.]
MIVKIILKKLRGTLREEEEILFKKWLFENAENIKTYNRLKNLKQQNGTLPDIDDLDPNEAWKVISATLSENNNKKTFSRSNSNFWRYAATVAVIVGSFVFYNSMGFFSNSEPKVDKNAIILKVGDGHNQVLSYKGNSTIVNSDGQSLGEKSDGVIDYTESSNDNLKIEYTTLQIPNGKKFKIVLSDGTLVHLNSGSSLRYPSRFQNGKNREVTLTGEAYFDVKKNEREPFIVTAGSMAVRVLGTSFNVRDYPEESNQNTVLVEGAVQIYEAGSLYNKDRATLLSPGFKAEWNASLKKTRIDKVDIDLYTGWTEGKLIMKKVSFSTIIKRLERHYGVQIKNEYTDLNERTFTATFESESIDQVLETFAIETPFTYEIDIDQIRIYKSTNQNS